MSSFFGDCLQNNIWLFAERTKLLRKLEKTGWIDIDVNYDYQELVNFFDYSISLIEAFIDIERMNNVNPQ